MQRAPNFLSVQRIHSIIIFWTIPSAANPLLMSTCFSNKNFDLSVSITGPILFHDDSVSFVAMSTSKDRDPGDLIPSWHYLGVTLIVFKSFSRTPATAISGASSLLLKASVPSVNSHQSATVLRWFMPALGIISESVSIPWRRHITCLLTTAVRFRPLLGTWGFVLLVMFVPLTGNCR